MDYITLYLAAFPVDDRHGRLSEKVMADDPFCVYGLKTERKALCGVAGYRFERGISAVPIVDASSLVVKVYPIGSWNSFVRHEVGT